MYGYQVRRPRPVPDQYWHDPIFEEKNGYKRLDVGAWIAGFLVPIDAEAHARASSQINSHQIIEIWDFTGDPVILSRWKAGERVRP